MNSEGCYGECLVHKQTPKSTLLIKALVIASIVCTGFGSLVFTAGGQKGVAALCLIVAIALVIMAVVLFPRFNVDWEYIFVDGQLDFDQIFSGSSRKRRLRIDFDTLEALAPTGSHHLDNFKNMKSKDYDFSSMTGNDGHTIVCHVGNDVVKIKFEPNEEMLKLMKGKCPRKVFLD